MNGVRVHNLTVYADLSPMVLVLSVLAVYLAVRLVLLVFGPPADQEPWQLELCLACLLYTSASAASFCFLAFSASNSLP